MNFKEYVTEGDKTAISKKVALRMYWDAGFDTESLIKIANTSLDKLKQPTKGYYYPDDVKNSIKLDKKEEMK